MRAMNGLYDPPSNYGIPNPYGPRTHNWRGGPLNEGSLFHGPIYTRPQFVPTWIEQTLNGQSGLGEEPEPASPGRLLMWFGVAAVGVMIFAYTVRSPEKSR